MTGWQKSNVLTSSTTSRASRAVCEVSGAVVSRDDLTERVRWLLDIVEGAERDLLSELWVPETFDRIHSGVDEGGRRLPAAAAVVGQRCGWRPQFPQDMYVPSRVMRIVTAQVISTLRTLAFRDAAIAAEVSGGASDGTAGLGGAFARNVHRQIARWVRLHPGVDPAGLRITTLQPVPSVARRVRLGAVDAQLATLVTSTATELTLRIKLPVRQHPDSRTDWRWVQLDIPIPQHLHHRSITGWHLPEVTLDRRGALFRFAFAETVPRPPTVANAASAVGVDWSPKDMVVAATVVRDTQSNAMYSDFRGRRFDDHGLSVKLARLQRQGQFLRRKIARLEQLIPQASIPTASGVYSHHQIGELSIVQPCHSFESQQLFADPRSMPGNTEQTGKGCCTSSATHRRAGIETKSPVTASADQQNYSLVNKPPDLPKHPCDYRSLTPTDIHSGVHKCQRSVDAVVGRPPENVLGLLGDAPR